jgi:hypothetical protein
MSEVLLSDLSGARWDDDGARRDGWGRYLIVPPEGGLPVPYRRVTTVAKALDSGGALTPWSASRAIRGLVADPDLLRRSRRLLRGKPDPWYDTPDTKAAFKQLVSDATKAGGADERRDRGTWLHSVAQRWLTGQPQPGTFSKHDRAWLDQFQQTLVDHGLWIDPDWVETIVVHDGPRVAGKADYLQTRMVGWDLPMIGDLKTGDSLEYALHGFVIQLATYATADNAYMQGAADDGSDDVRRTMPKVDQTHALLIHAPQTGGEFSVWMIDVQAGLQAFRLAQQVEAWRAESAIVERVDPDLTRVLAESIVVVQDRKRRAWLQERIDQIGSSPGSRAWLARAWPADLPVLSQSDQHTLVQLQEIERLCNEAEREFALPFGPKPPEPTFDAIAYLMAQFPGSTLLSGDSDTGDDDE